MVFQCAGSEPSMGGSVYRLTDLCFSQKEAPDVVTAAFKGLALLLTKV